MLLTAVFLGGCGHTDEYEPKEVLVDLAAEDIVSVSYRNNHMDRFYAFRFSLEEKDGSWIYSGSYGNLDTDEIVEIEEVEVPVEKMEELRKIIEDEDLIAQVPSYDGIVEDKGEQDRTVYTLSLRFKDKTELKAENVGKISESLYEAFRAIGEEIK